MSMLGAICGSAISMDLLAQSMDPYSAQKSMDCADICGSLRVVYLFHIFTQGKPKQLTLVSIGALHTFHIVINMYVNLNIIQYSQICASITHIKTLHV